MLDPEPPDGDGANRRRKRWIGLLGCLAAVALVVFLATLIAWWTQSGVFAPQDQRMLRPHRHCSSDERSYRRWELPPRPENASRQAARQRQFYRERKDRTIGGNDMLIAAHALALGCTIVTSNVEEFSRVKGLRVEDWSKGKA